MPRIGDIVLYQYAAGEFRPALVTEVVSPEIIAATVFFNEWDLVPEVMVGFKRIGWISRGRGITQWCYKEQ